MLSKFFGSMMVLSFLVTSAWAEAPAVPAGGAAPAGAPPQPGIGGMLVPFIAMFAVVYFLMIRPQQKKMKEQQNMLSALQTGDEVITSSGIIGKIAGMTEKVITLEIADGVKIKVLRSQVAQVVKGQIKDLV